MRETEVVGNRFVPSEIERLQAEIERLRAALRRIADTKPLTDQAAFLIEVTLAEEYAQTVRKATIEECARAAERFHRPAWGVDIAAAIRALKDKP